MGTSAELGLRIKDRVTIVDLRTQHNGRDHTDGSWFRPGWSWFDSGNPVRCDAAFGRVVNTSDRRTELEVLASTSSRFQPGTVVSVSADYPGLMRGKSDPLRQRLRAKGIEVETFRGEQQEVTGMRVVYASPKTSSVGV